MPVRAVLAQDTFSNQEVTKFIQHCLDLGLDAFDVEAVNIVAVTFHAAGYLRFKGMAAFFTHMATHTGSLNSVVMVAWAAGFNTSASDAKHHRTLWSMVGAPMFTDASDDAVFRNGEIPARLVAVDTQVTFTAVKGCTFNGKEGHRVGCFQREVITGIAGVNLVTCAAILSGWIRIARFNFSRMKAGSNTLAESPARVTSRTGCTGTAQKRSTGSVRRHL
jgi:hypothetical protein